MDRDKKYLEDKADWLTTTAADLSEQLNKKKNLASVAQLAYQDMLDGDEIVQVQVVVTRREVDFIGDFITIETEERKNVKGNGKRE